MPQVSFESLLSRIRMEVPQCPRELMTSELVRVTRDFCQHTRAFQSEVTDQDITVNVSDYAIVVPNDQVQPIAIEFLEVDGVQSIFTEIAWLNANIADWRKREADDFRYFTHIQPRKITFPCVPTESKVDVLDYRVSLKPELDADTIDEAFTDEWLEILEAGTKAHLMLMDGKPWYRPTRAAGLLAMYRAERALARVRVNHAFGNPDQRVMAPKFA